MKRSKFDILKIQTSNVALVKYMDDNSNDHITSFQNAKTVQEYLMFQETNK